MDTAILVALVAVPLGLQLFLSSNGSLGFLALCAGAVLQRVLSDSAPVSWGGDMIIDWANNPGVGVFAISLPFVLTIFLTAGRAKGNVRFMHLIPGLAAGGLFALLVSPLLAINLQPTLLNAPVWEYATKAQLAIVVIGVIFSLLMVWLKRPQHKGHKKSH